MSPRSTSRPSGRKTTGRSAGGDLEPVLETCRMAKELGVHLEVAYPMIPGVNDSAGEMAPLFHWILENLGSGTPLHLFRFSPSYRLSHLRRESLATMRRERAAALRAGLKYVYFGGTLSPEEQNTHCPRCGALLVSRVAEETAEKIYVRKEEMSRFCPSYSDVKVLLKDGRCPSCGEAIGIRFA